MGQQSGRTERDGVELAWRLTPGNGPTTVFLPGFRSDMGGAKALETQAFCERNGLGCLLLDYSGKWGEWGNVRRGDDRAVAGRCAVPDRPAYRG